MAAQDQQVNYQNSVYPTVPTPPPQPKADRPLDETPAPAAPEISPPATMTPPSGGSRFPFSARKLPLKVILIAVGALILVTLLILGIKAFFGGREKTPAQANLT